MVEPRKPLLSEALQQIWEHVQLSPAFKDYQSSEAFKMFKQLYREVLEVEKEKDFNDE